MKAFMNVWTSKSQLETDTITEKLHNLTQLLQAKGTELLIAFQGIEPDGIPAISYNGTTYRYLSGITRLIDGLGK